MDSHAEQIVKKSDGGSDNLKRMLCLAGGVAAGVLLIAAGMFLRLAIVGSLLGVAALYGGILLSSNFDVEYEYIIVNGELDIDKILGKKKRKSMLTVKASDFENFGKYDKLTKENDDATIIWAVGTSIFDEEDPDTYFADFDHSVYGKCRLLFSPSDKILREIKLYLKGNLKQTIGDLPEEKEYDL
ncbi:MAG: hypothetical protein E7505_01290 [Ruminococcus sp.]|nr:hypothetical protein [Ruminococcus sp.]